MIQFNILTSINCKERVDNILNTWGADIKQNIVFFSDYTDEEKNILQVTTNTGYTGAAEKTYKRILQIIESDIEWDWYYFIDDDTYVNIAGANRFIDRVKDIEKVYGRLCGPDHYQYIHGGAGILIGRKALKNIDIKTLSEETLAKSSGFSDLFWGILFKENNIPLEFYNNSFCGWEHELDINNDIVSVHPVRTLERMEYYKNLLK